HRRLPVPVQPDPAARPAASLAVRSQRRRGDGEPGGLPERLRGLCPGHHDGPADVRNPQQHPAIGRAMIRTSTFALHDLHLFNASRTQTRMQDATTQISSGKQSQNYAGLAEDSPRLISLESTHVRSANFHKQIDLVSSRLTTMES